MSEKKAEACGACVLTLSFKYLFIECMYVCVLHVCMYTLHIPDALRVQKWVLDALGLEL